MKKTDLRRPGRFELGMDLGAILLSIAILLYFDHEFIIGKSAQVCQGKIQEYLDNFY